MGEEYLVSSNFQISEIRCENNKMLKFILKKQCWVKWVRLCCDQMQ